MEKKIDVKINKTTYLMNKKEYPKEYCIIKILSKEDNTEIAYIDGGCYDNVQKVDSFHINHLNVNEKYQKKGIGTFLVKELLKYIKKNRIKYVTTNPCSKGDMTQEKLKSFYKSFTYHYFFKKMKITFKISPF